jgi:hypothetical protein
LTAIDVDPRINDAAALVRQMPLRWSDGDSDNTVEDVLADGWFRGPNECARVLTNMAPMELSAGHGFGGRWPLLVGSGWTLAPALPAALRAEGVVANDGEYRWDRQGVWREAVGVEELYLTTDGSQPAPGEPFDLLWFGDSERFTVRDGILEIEDLFGMLRVPATASLLERILIRAKRVDPAVLSSLDTADSTQMQTIEVRRKAILSADERLRDPSTFLGARADIESAQIQGDNIEVRTAGGATVLFALEEFESGWRLTLRNGSYAFKRIRLEQRAATIGVRVTLNDGLDALAPGMRGRIIFDLRSDLVALGR